MDYWNHVLWSDETKIKLIWFRWCPSVCGGNQVRSTKTSVSCLQSSMGVGSVVVWGAAWVLPALGELQFIEGKPWMPTMYCDILKTEHDTLPSERWAHRAVFQHDNEHCLAKEAEGKRWWTGQNLSPDLNLYWAYCGASSNGKGEEQQGL